MSIREREKLKAELRTSKDWNRIEKLLRLLCTSDVPRAAGTMKQIASRK